jgi:hypothetical protein
VNSLLLAVVPLAALALLLLRMRKPPRLTLDVEGNVLRVRQGFWDGVYCLKRGLDLPVAEIEGVSAAPRGVIPATGLRLPGTSMPGVIRAGSYGTGATRDFWNVRRAKIVLVVQMRPVANYRRIVLEVPDPHAQALRLVPALGAYEGTFTT